MNSETSRARRRISPAALPARKPGVVWPKSASDPLGRPGAPANKKGVLAGHEEEIVAMYADGQGRRVSSIARTFGVSSNAIKKCLRLPRRGPNKKNSRFGKRFSKCCACWSPIPVAGAATRGFCDPCIQRAFKTITVYDRDTGVGEIPEALCRRYSLSG